MFGERQVKEKHVVVSRQMDACGTVAVVDDGEIDMRSLGAAAAAAAAAFAPSAPPVASMQNSFAGLVCFVGSVASCTSMTAGLGCFLGVVASCTSMTAGPDFGFDGGSLPSVTVHSTGGFEGSWGAFRLQQQQ